MAARSGQSLEQPLAGLSLSPRADHSFQDVHVCLEVIRMLVLGFKGTYVFFNYDSNFKSYVASKNNIYIFLFAGLLIGKLFNLCPVLRCPNCPADW